MQAVRETTLSEVRQRIAEHGLEVLGSLTLEATDPYQPAGLPFVTRTLILIGNVGSGIWPAFSQSPEFLDGESDPLDRMSQRVGDQLAEAFGGEALYPFGGPPYQPFLRWAEKAGAGWPSPLGLTLHPEFGLWHGYRFALAFPERIADLSEPAKTIHACNSCETKPCLQACPVGAFTGDAYRVTECATFLKRNPDYVCNSLGCDARRQCPQGQQYRYCEDHARFHMNVFIALHAHEDN